MIEELKDTRVKLDGLHSVCLTIKSHHIYPKNNPIIFGEILEGVPVSSDEIKEAAKFIKSSRKWTGLLMQYISDIPLDVSEDHHKSLPISLEVQTNETKPIGASTRPFNTLETIEWLQMELDILISYIESIHQPKNEVINCKNRIWSDLHEAKMMLDDELIRIKKSNRNV